MQRVLVVYESMFGNTARVAEAIGAGLAGEASVEVAPVAAAPVSITHDLLVVGGPTHAHGMSSRQSRDSADRQDLIDSASIDVGIREWLARLEGNLRPVHAAAFDTRIKGPRLLWGSAARAIDRRMREMGMAMAAPPESFLVSGPTGPVHDALLEGELDRARSWGAELSRTAPAPTAGGG